MAINGEYPTRYGGVGTMSLVEQEGQLKAGVALSFREPGVIELQRLCPLIRSGATVRVTRSKHKPREAVLTFSSEKWEGSAMIVAKVEGL